MNVSFDIMVIEYCGLVKSHGQDSCSKPNFYHLTLSLCFCVHNQSVLNKHLHNSKLGLSECKLEVLWDWFLFLVFILRYGAFQICPVLSGQLNVSFRKAVSFMWTWSRSYLSSNKQVFQIHAGQAGMPAPANVRDALTTTTALHYEEKENLSQLGERVVLCSIYECYFMELFPVVCSAQNSTHSVQSSTNKLHCIFKSSFNEIVLHFKTCETFS